MAKPLIRIKILPEFHTEIDEAIVDNQNQTKAVDGKRQNLPRGSHQEFTQYSDGESI